MKLKLTLQNLVVAAAAIFVTSQAPAQITITQIPGYFAEAGEFNITPVVGTGYGPSALVNNGFQSFCISRNAGIGIPGQYFEIMDTNGIYLPDNLTISKGSAWLYSNFCSNTLTGYHYAGAAITDPGHTLSERAEDAYTLQLAFWTLEGQYWYGPGPGSLSLNEDIAANHWLQMVADAFGGGTAGLLAAMSANSPGDFNVGVLNLYTINPDNTIGSVVQPVLVLLNASETCTNPDGTITAPISVVTGSGNNIASVPDAGTNATYVWTISNGTIDNGQGTSQISFTAGTSGSVTVGVTVTVSGGCSAQDSKTITITCVTPSAAISAPIAVNPGSTNSASVTDAGTGATYVWTIGNGTIVGGQGTSSIQFIAGTSGSVTLGVTVTVPGGCTAGSSKAVTITCVSPSAKISAPLTVSALSTGNTASVPDAGVGATYVWTIKNGTITGGQGTSTITWTAGTNGVTALSVTIAVPGGCDSTGCRYVCVVCQAPNANITTALSVKAGSTNNTASVANAGAGATYVWTISNGTITSGQGTPTIKWTAGLSGAKTVISVTVTTAAGCSAQDCNYVCLTSPYCTYTIGGWGACPNGNNVAALLASKFSTAYPKGLVVGGTCTNKFTSALAIQNYLPDGGTANVLSKSSINPLTTDAKVFGSQVTALKLNVDFSNLGYIRPGLANLHVAPGKKLAGYTVAQVLTLANKVLGGNLSALPAGCSLTDLNNVCDSINNNFDGGAVNNGFLVP